MRQTYGVLATCAALLTAALPSPSAAQLPPIETSGRIIEAVDGDVVVINSTDSVMIVRRLRGLGRFVLAPDASRLLLVMDTAEMGIAQGAKRFYSWHLTNAGAWPLDRRWEGMLTVDTFQPGTGPRIPTGQMVHTDQGAIFIGRTNGFTLAPTPLVVLDVDRAGSSHASGTLDEIEQRWLAGGDDAITRGSVARLSMTAQPSGPPRMATFPSRDAQHSPDGTHAGPYRVGGAIAPPRLTRRVEAVTPQAAREAGISGVVILELVVGPDGKVADARILRSIAPLDEAALAAVRQWEYEPTIVEGTPATVILTATVAFQR